MKSLYFYCLLHEICTCEVICWLWQMLILLCLSLSFSLFSTSCWLLHCYQWKAAALRAGVLSSVFCEACSFWHNLSSGFHLLALLRYTTTHGFERKYVCSRSFAADGAVVFSRFWFSLIPKLPLHTFTYCLSHLTDLLLC